MRRWAAAFLVALLVPNGALATNEPLMLNSATRSVALSLFDIADIALSESGGITDVFVTLMPGVQAQLGALALTEGARLDVTICALHFQTAPLRAPFTGHLYLVQTTMIRGEALQALWQGRAQCDTLAPEVFADDN